MEMKEEKKTPTHYVVHVRRLHPMIFGSILFTPFHTLLYYTINAKE